jgi:hypothetical protein
VVLVTRVHMNIQDLLYVGIAVAFFVGCDRLLALIDERTAERRR